LIGRRKWDDPEVLSERNILLGPNDQFALAFVNQKRESPVNGVNGVNGFNGVNGVNEVNWQDKDRNYRLQTVAKSTQ